MRTMRLNRHTLFLSNSNKMIAWFPSAVIGSVIDKPWPVWTWILMLLGGSSRRELPWSCWEFLRAQSWVLTTRAGRLVPAFEVLR